MADVQQQEPSMGNAEEGPSIGDAAKKFGKRAATSTLNIGSTLLHTADRVTGSVGDALHAATATGVNVLKTANATTKYLNTSAEGWAERNITNQENKTGVYKVQSASDAATEKARIELDTQRKIDEIKQKQIKADIDQERKIAALSKQKTLSKQEQDENQGKVDIGYYYGFKSDTSPYDAGKSASSIYFSFDKSWYYYYYPIYFIDDKGEFHEITLPPKGIDGGNREKKILVHDNTANTDIFIDFVRTAGKIYGDLMVPKITDVVSGVEIPIKKIEFAKGWCYILKMVGGIRRKTNRRTNKKTNRRTNKRRRTIRRRRY